MSRLSSVQRFAGLVNALRAESSLNANLAAASAARGFAADTDEIEVTLCRKFQVHNIEAPGQTVKTSKAELKGMYELMTRMRRMEIAADVLYKSKLIRGFCHLYDGQEAIAVGMNAALKPTDSIVTSYRDHCIHLMRGGTVLEVIAELMGRSTGASKGLGGSMHMYNKEQEYYGGHGIVGAQIPIGAGLAFRHQYLKDGGIAISMFGDGAANQGQHFEALNMAAIWDLPCVFMVENNRYGMGTAATRAAKSSEFYKRGGYVPGIKVDGMDALAVKQAMSFVREYVSKTGPMVVEMDTYRYHGHSMSDPGTTYRSRDEINELREKRDPIEHIKKVLLEQTKTDAAELKEIDRKVKKEIDEAVEAAKNSPWPEPSKILTEYVYVDGVEGIYRGVDSSNWFKVRKHAGERPHNG